MAATLELKHGLRSTYNNHGCRCEACTEDQISYQRKWRLRKHFQMSEEEWLTMLVLQNSRCAICSKDFSEMKDIQVDHDHNCCPGRETCGQCIRGLLCWRCNSLSGQIERIGLSRFSEYLGVA